MLVWLWKARLSLYVANFEEPERGGLCNCAARIIGDACAEECYARTG